VKDLGESRDGACPEQANRADGACPERANRADGSQPALSGAEGFFTTH